MEVTSDIEPPTPMTPSNQDSELALAVALSLQSVAEERQMDDIRRFYEEQMQQQQQIGPGTLVTATMGDDDGYASDDWVAASDNEAVFEEE
jgi:hypothetical protein